MPRGDAPASTVREGDKPHRRLTLWQDSVSFIEEVYRVTASFPAAERYGLAAQLRRAAVSITANIAGGAARQSKLEFRHFLFVARGPMSEVDTQLEVAARLGYISRADADTLGVKIDSPMKMLHGVVRYLKSARTTGE